MGEHGMYDKRFMYEESIHIPLIMMHKDSIGYNRLEYSHQVTNLDIAPTILDIAGISIPQDLQGVSLKSTFHPGAPAVHSDAIYYNYYEYGGWHGVQKHCGIRTDSYKLIKFYGDDGNSKCIHGNSGWEMYDIREGRDPEEMTNLWGKSAYSDD